MKLKFINSFIYDSLIHKALKKEYDYDKSQELYEEFISEIEPKWREIEEKVFSKINEVTGLKWKENKKCYFVSHDLFMPFSEPLTIGIKGPSGRKRGWGFIRTTLIHELIHEILTQNHNKKYLDHIYSGSESDVTKIHVPVHAIYELVADSKDVEFDKDKCKTWKLTDYIRAWEIVEEKGAQNIVNEMKSFYS